jgi:hypothetical protein
LAVQVHEAESGREGCSYGRGIGGCRGERCRVGARVELGQGDAAGTGSLILTLQVLLGGINMQQGHVGIVMAQ